MDKDEHGNPIVKDEGATTEEGADNTPKQDAFGADNQPPTPPKKGGKEQGEGKDDDIENNPLVKELRTQIESVKKEYGTNLSGQRTVIERLEKEIEALKKGGKPTGEGEGGDADGEVLFKDIKRSKDLTKDERDEMTETEIRQMDQIADMQEAQNKLYAELQKKGKTEETKQVEDLNTTVRSAALELSKGEDGKENTELANQIIESFKAMKFSTDGLSAEDIKKRVKLAAGEVPDYKPPKEQPSNNGKGKVVKKGASDTDPFGVDAIVEEATKGQDGNYTL